MTLVELLIAMSLSLIVAAAIITIFTCRNIIQIKTI